VFGFGFGRGFNHGRRRATYFTLTRMRTAGLLGSCDARLLGAFAARKLHALSAA
jgi:hypothetical protein